ncbi:MAG: hypothetical protein PHR15_06425 [Atopobiaceae bacterium]|jgi:hypothetical protein|nr:hypothetical protein [Atopobiaceae bacterium]MCH4180697.1 hypothetical protein [Atopobiaceae bacterium]MCH4214714.1 hypothetical protein [Atopobiaceae bacterium]MCH4276760.1 hypothetical protein [Atopobiaceae bacterium]MCI1226592.1 hypothetical protein [Atopobiaceae bacterium]
MGAHFELLAFAKADIARVWFLSPVTNMERIIHNIMGYCHITEKDFRQQVSVDNDIEPLYWPYYEYVRDHPVTAWGHETHILRGEGDTMCEYDVVHAFAERFGCELTQQAGGEHWFHTEAELEYFRWRLGDRL